MKPVTRWIVLSPSDATHVVATHQSRGAAFDDARQRTAESGTEYTALFQIVPPVVILEEFDQLLFARLYQRE
jgi:hypothetical protein